MELELTSLRTFDYYIISFVDDLVVGIYSKKYYSSVDPSVNTI